MNQTTSSQVNDDIIADAAAQWFMRLQEDDCTDAERNAFAQWLAADPRHAREYEAMRETWAACEGLPPTVSPPHAAQHAAPAATPAAPRSKRHTRLFSLAAALVVSLAVGWHQGWIPCEYSSHQAAEATRLVTLPDGSRVELNINTHLTYTRYSDRRVVNLDHGEAFFEIAKDMAHPFIVQAAEGSVQATGTRFNVWLYDKSVRVVLIEGAVQVASDRAYPGRSVLLAPGMQASYQGGDPQPRVSRTQLADTSLAWRNGKLVFSDLSLRQALPLINRYLTKPVMLADNATGDLRLGLNYNTREIAGLVDSLPQVLPVKISHNAQGNPVLQRQGTTAPRS